MSYLEKERSYLPWLSTSVGVHSSLLKYKITKEKKYGLIVVNYLFHNYSFTIFFLINVFVFQILSSTFFLIQQEKYLDVASNTLAALGCEAIKNEAESLQ